MGRSKFFLLVSLVFLSINFVWLKFVDQPGIIKDLSAEVFYLWLILIVSLGLSWRWRYFFLLAVGTLAVLRITYFGQHIYHNQDFIFDQRYSFTAQVVDLDKRLDSWQVWLEPYDLNNWQGKISASLPLYPEYKLGQVVKVAGLIRQPQPFDEFAYDKYLAKDSIMGTMYRPSLRIVDQIYNWQYYLSHGKWYWLDKFDRYLVEPTSALAKAMMLDARGEMTSELKQTFSKVGLSHIVAISGSHIVIIIWLFKIVFDKLGLSRKNTFIWLVLILFFYLQLIAWLASALRSVLMALFVLAAPWLGRPTASVPSLLFLADFFVLLNPYLLIYDIGFQLSFLAVLGLILYAKYFDHLLRWLPNIICLRDVLAMTLAAQVLTWPIIVYNFHILSLVSPLANFLVAPFLTVILILGILLGLVGWWWLSAWLMAWPLFILLKLVVEISDWLARLPGAFIMIENFSAAWLITSLAITAGLTWLIKPYRYE